MASVKKGARAPKKAEMAMVINAFSVNMITYFPSNIRFEEIGIEEARDLYEMEFGGRDSAVGPPSTAAVSSAVLGREVENERKIAELLPGDVILLEQYRGPRLPEGATELPLEAEIRWYRVEVLAPGLDIWAGDHRGESPEGGRNDDNSRSHLRMVRAGGT